MSEWRNGILKPCPFCGGTVTIRWDGYYQAPVIRHEDHKVICIADHGVFYGFPMEKVVEMWNRRAVSFEDDGLTPRDLEAAKYLLKKHSEKVLAEYEAQTKLFDILTKHKNKKTEDG